MRTQSKTSRHFTDEQLIDQMYGADLVSQYSETLPHLVDCRECGSRLAAMHTRWKDVAGESERNSLPVGFLAEQRRGIYAKLGKSVRWWRWVSAGTAAAVLGVGLIITGEGNRSDWHDSRVSDVQLAKEVSALSLDLEAKPAAPLQALFE